MDIRTVQDAYTYLYDPALFGYDTDFFATVSGTPSATASIIRLTGVGAVAAECATKAQYLMGSVTMSLVIPAVPTAADDRRWGLYSGALLLTNAAFFTIVGDKFYARTYYAAGTKEETEITWVTGASPWEGVITKFRISWERANEIKFFVNDIEKAKHYVSLPDKLTLPLNFRNLNADNMDIDHIIFKGILKQVGVEAAI
jgi:hypothetical protein